MPCLDLLTCGKLLRIYFVIKVCCLPVLLFISGYVLQYVGETLQKAELPPVVLQLTSCLLV